MKRAPLPGVDLGVYAAALPLLARNPALLVVPLVTLVAGVLLRHVLVPFGGGVAGGLTAGLAGFIMMILALYGFGSACVLADDAWRHGRGSFDRAWLETQRKSGDLLSAALGVTMIFVVAQYIAQLVGALGIVVLALAVYFLIFAVPAAAVGGVPGGAAIQASIDRVRSSPLPAALAAIVTLVLVFFAAPAAAVAIGGATAAAWLYGGAVGFDLLYALLQSIAIAYVALVLTKIYTDSAFTRRW